MKDKDPFSGNQSRNDESDKDELRPLQEPYVVGYGKPPLAMRFEKGRSGNPHGRPRGRLSKESIQRMVDDAFLNSQVTIRDSRGRKRTVSKLQGVFIDTINRALTGCHRYKQLVFEMAEKYSVSDESVAAIENADEDDAILRRHRLDLAVGEDVSAAGLRESDTQDEEGD